MHQRQYFHPPPAVCTVAWHTAIEGAVTLSFVFLPEVLLCNTIYLGILFGIHFSPVLNAVTLTCFEPPSSWDSQIKPAASLYSSYKPIIVSRSWAVGYEGVLPGKFENLRHVYGQKKSSLS